MNINVLLVLPHLTHKCLHTSSEIIDLAEYVLNRLIHQANEDQPVEYNFDILEDQEHHDNHILVWMVSNYITKVFCLRWKHRCMWGSPLTMQVLII